MNGNIALADGFLKLPKFDKVKIRECSPIPDGYQLKSVTVSCTPSGKYFAAIPYAYEAYSTTCPHPRGLGLDYSMPELYIPSEGEAADYSRYYRRSLDKLRRMQRTLSKMVRGSQHYHKQRKRIAILHERISKHRKDFLHKQSRR